MKKIVIIISTLINLIYASITGTVFKDFNANGIIDQGEVGVKDIKITAYDTNGTIQGVAYSNENGEYILNPSGNPPYRIEFSNIPPYLKVGATKAQNSAKVQFVNSKDVSNINFALNNPAQYNIGKEKSIFAVSVQHPGASHEQNDITKEYGIISLPFNATGKANGDDPIPGDPPPSKDVEFSKMGTVWGAAYQRKSGYLYEAAFLKRHQGLGELVRPPINQGERDVVVDGIYIVEYNASIGGKYLGGFKLNGINPSAGNGGVINLGSVKREIIDSKINKYHPNALTTYKRNRRSYDIDAFSKVGKVGFGDLDIEENDNYLWVVNLNQKSLIRIDATDPKKLITNDTIDPSLVAHYKIDFSSLGECEGEFRPWALAFNELKGYIGIICDGKDNNALKGYILEFDPKEPTTFNLIKEFPLNYPRESAQYTPDYGTCALGSQSNWNHWANSWDELGSALGKNAKGADDDTYGAERACPQPIISDITFDANNDMVIALMDRFSLQLDRVNYAATTTIGTNKYYSVDSAGDILHLCYNKGEYLLEGEEGCIIDSDDKEDGDKPSDRLKIDDGPNGVGEFYYQDYSSQYDYGKSLHHAETALGSATILPGTSQVLLTVYDAIIGEFNQGFLWFNTNSASKDKGKRANQYQISKEGSDEINTKGSALGDVELLLPPAPIEVGDRVWFDNDKDGVQDPNEEGIKDVKVQLVCNDKVVGEVTTNEDGYYLFSNDPNGENSEFAQYNIEELQPNNPNNCYIKIPDAKGENQQSALEGKMLTIKDSGEGEEPNINDSNGYEKDNDVIVDIPSDSIDSAGANNHTFDVGFKNALGCVGDFVWEDSNHNGIQDEGEKGISGIRVKVLDANTKKEIEGKNSTTDENGYYQICDLPEGNYIVEFEKEDFPKNYQVTLNNQGDDAKDSDVDPANEIPQSDLFYLPAGENNNSIDLGLTKTLCIGDRIWLDSNYNGIQDENESSFNEEVIVELLDENGNRAKDIDNKEISPITTKDGNYTFCNLKEGEYKVKFTLPNGYIFTKKDSSDDNIDSDVNLDNNSSDLIDLKNNNYNIDAGVVKLATLGDYIWEDKNQNGIQDNNETGIKNIKVTLYKDGEEISTTYTNENGVYNFDNLEPGKYKIKVELPSDNMSFSPPNIGDDESIDSDITQIEKENNKTVGYSQEVRLNSGDINKNLDGGIYFLYKPAIDIEKYTNDKDSDKAPGETLAVGSKVVWKYVVKNIGDIKLKDIKVIDDKEGEINCPKDTLDVNESMTCTKEGLVKEGEYENVATVKAKDPSDKEVSDEDPSHYFGVNSASIGDFIWEDLNANGIQDINETGIKDVKVELLDENNKSVTDINGSLVEPIYTDSNGYYKFTNLIPNRKYHIKITPPSNYYISPKDMRDNDNLDSDIDPDTKESPNILLKDGEFNKSVDGGLFKGICIEDRVWEDINFNGVFDKNIDKLIEGAKIEIFSQDHSRVYDLNGNLVEPVYSNENGVYKFCNLLPGKKYIIRVTPPSDKYTAILNNAPDSTQNYFEVIKDVTPFSDQIYKSLDAGFFQYASLGDKIWLDENLDGIQDEKEFAIIGVKVELYDDKGELLKSTKTDKKGEYHFDKLIPGKKYSIKIYPPNGYIFTEANATKDESKDSDADENGYIKDIILKSGENNLTFDAGVYCECISQKGSLELTKDGDSTPSLNIFIALLLIGGIFTLTLKIDRRNSQL